MDIALRHIPTHDWIIGKKVHEPAPDERPDIVTVKGVARIAQKPPHHYAVVLAIGPGRVHPETGFTPAPIVRIGDVVMVRAVAGDPEVIENEEYHWFMPDEVLAILPPVTPVE